MTQTTQTDAQETLTEATRSADNAPMPVPERRHGRGNPWMWLAAAMAIIMMLMAFALGYLVADRNQTADKTQQQQQAQQANMPTSEQVKQLRQTMDSIETKPTTVDRQGLIVVSKNGYGKTVKNAPTVTVFEEPLCPFCGQLNRALDETLVELVDAGQINLRIGLVNFLNQASSDSYSNRAVNGALAIAEQDQDPHHLLNYLSNLYAEDWMPQEGQNYKPVSDDMLKERAVKAGTSQEVADQAFDGQNKYGKWIDAMTAYTTSRTELWGEGQQGFSTPAMLINGEYWATSNAMSDVSKAGQALLDAIGLDPNDVGNAKAKPSIGADGKPIER